MLAACRAALPIQLLVHWPGPSGRWRLYVRFPGRPSKILAPRCQWDSRRDGLSCVTRKSKAKGRATARFALEFQPSAHQGHQLFGKRQAHPDPFCAVSQTTVDLGERVLECFEAFGGNAAPGVRDGEFQGARFGRRWLSADVDRALRGEFNGVVQEQG